MQPQTKNPPFGGLVRHIALGQKLKMDFNSFSISSDRFRSFSRYAGVSTSLAASISSLATTDRRELFKSVSIRWTLLRSRLLESSLAMVASHTGGLWLGLRSRYNADAARFFFRGSLEAWQAKSELPKNYESCPINRRKRLVIGQSQN